MKNALSYFWHKSSRSGVELQVSNASYLSQIAYPKVIENEISGIISKNNDPQELSKIIEYLLLHKEAAKIMGKKACVRAKKLLDVKVIAKQHYEAYRKIIEIY